MKCTYAVTFEFENAPPITARGTILASAARTIAARAVEQAQKAHPGLHWTSLSLWLAREGLVEAHN